MRKAACTIGVDAERRGWLASARAVGGRCRPRAVHRLLRWSVLGEGESGTRRCHRTTGEADASLLRRALATDKTLRGKVFVRMTVGNDGRLCEAGSASEQGSKSVGSNPGGCE
jgi:hypothetical protein